MARAIVRYSITGEGNATGNKARGVLEKGGFARIGTASYELRDSRKASVLVVLRELLEVLDERPGGGTLDHLYVYLDVPESN